MPFRIGGSSGNGGGSSVNPNSILPDGYSYKKNSTTGKLELWKGTQQIAVQDDSGSWFKTAISTGVGSLHLGGNEAGGVAHSASSIGQNLGFKNEFSKSVDGEKICFFPLWQGVSTDGESLINPSMLNFSEVVYTTPNSFANTTTSVDYNFSVVFPSNSATFSVTVIPAENYTGKLTNVITSNVTNVEIYNTTVQVTATVDNDLIVGYKYPFFVRTGDNLKLQLLKSDGTFLKVRSGMTNATIPYRLLKQRTYEDFSIASNTSKSRLLRDISANTYWFEDFTEGYIEPVAASPLTRTECFGLTYNATLSAWSMTVFDALPTDPNSNLATERHIGAVQFIASSGSNVAGGISLRLSPASKISQFGGRFGGRMMPCFGYTTANPSTIRFTGGIFLDAFTVPTSDARQTACILGFDIVGSTTLRPIQNGAAVGSDITVTSASVIDWFIEKPAGEAENGKYRLVIFVDGISVYDSGLYTITGFPTSNVEFAIRAGKSSTALPSAGAYQFDYLYAYTLSGQDRFVPPM